MKNWSDSVKWHPQEILYPASETEIQAIVLRALEQKKTIRVIGTGHSFSRLCATDDILISLDEYQGIVQVNEGTQQVSVKAGTKLRLLGDLLFKHGLAMENLGDIDAQSIAGTISTGTHGTGTQFGTISTQVVALKFVNGKGEVISCSKEENTELFKAAQVSLGVLGIITEITLQCVPAYRLEMLNRQESFEEVMGTLTQRNTDNRNFEFYCFPYSQKVWTKTANIAQDQPDKVGFANFLTEYVLENYAFKVLCEGARWFPGLNKNVAKISAASIPNIRKVFQSHKVYATKRLVRFYEMEYNIPTEAHGEVIREILGIIDKKKFNVHFPIENRFVKKDDIFMSPAYGRDSAYIACHVYNKKDYKAYFDALEPIFKAYQGRPHWGKMNTFSHEDIVNSYPQFSSFQQFRAEHDPNGLFLNDYLRQLLLDKAPILS